MTGIVCDTGTDVPNEVKNKEYVQVVKLKVLLGDEVIKDREEGNTEKIIEFMKTGFPKTSLPSFHEVKEKFQNLIDQGINDIIALNLSSELSGTHNVFRLVAEDLLKENDSLRIEVMDTLSVSIGSGVLIAKASEMIDDGVAYETIVDKLNQYIPGSSKVFFTIPTLKYLKEGGRIGKVSGTIAEVLNLKPIISVGDDGIYYTAAKARGLKKAYKKVIELATETIKSGNVRMAGIGWTGSDKRTLNKVDEIIETLKGFGIKKIFADHISASLLVNTGIGLIGISTLSE